MIVSRREFLILVGAGGVGALSGCDFLSRRQEVSKEQRVADLGRVAREIVSGKYSEVELEMTDFNLDEVSRAFSFKQQLDVNPLVVDVTNKYSNGKLVESQVRLAGGLYQPEVKALAYYKVPESLSDERIKAGELEKAARALLNFSSRAEFQVTKVDYMWGEVEAVAFTDTTSSGGRMQGYLDAKGQGKIQILHKS